MVLSGTRSNIGMVIPKIGSRKNLVSKTKGIVLGVYGTGVSIAFQSTLLIIDRRGVSIMSGVLPDP